MTVTEMRAKKKEMGYTNEQIAELSECTWKHAKILPKKLTKNYKL